MRDYKKIWNLKIGDKVKLNGKIYPIIKIKIDDEIEYVNGKSKRIDNKWFYLKNDLALDITKNWVLVMKQEYDQDMPGVENWSKIKIKELQVI